MQIQVIFQDDFILVIDKPPGLISDPANTHAEETVVSIMQNNFGIKLERGGVVHRLDKDTSGLMVIAKTQEALDFLQLQFRKRQTRKEYLALVHGHLSEERIVSGAIDRNPRNREKFVVLEGGKEAETRFVPEKNYQFPISSFQIIFNDLSSIQKRKLEKMGYVKFTLVRCYPLTGRTHQIRVHLKHINFPIVSDDKYVGRKISRLDRRWCPRQFLHAARLEFFHPKDGRRVSFKSDLPEDLKRALNNLNKLITHR